MFSNVLEELRYISEVTDSKGRKFILHIMRCVANAGTLEGFICYDFYLTDSKPEHDILVGIGHKAFAPEEYKTEEERLDALQPLLEEFINDGADKAFRILNE